jgi:hypothetical protein
MHRALCSIEETQARLRGISRNSLASREPPERRHQLSALRVGGGTYRADQEFHDVGEPIARRCTVTAADGQCGPGPSFDYPSQHSI